MTATLAEREAFTAELRRLCSASVGAALDADTIRDLTARLAEMNAELPVERVQWPWYWDLPPESRDGSAGWERFNPVTPPIRILDAAPEGMPRALARLDLPFTGPVASVHGGFVAAMLDHALGMYLRAIDRSSVTTELRIAYLAKTPLYVDLEIFIGYTEVDERRTEAWAEIRHGGRVTARADGNFLVVHSPSMRRTKVSS
jgi:acyl-coenzyme A thioesterase PaaI-like protein